MYLCGDGQDGDFDFVDCFIVYLVGCGSGCIEYVLIDCVSGEVYLGQIFNNGCLVYWCDSCLLIVMQNDGYGYFDWIEYLLWMGEWLECIVYEECVFVFD